MYSGLSFSDKCGFMIGCGEKWLLFFFFFVLENCKIPGS